MTTVSVPARPALSSERLFYLIMILAIIATALLGFARSVFLRPLYPGFQTPAEPLFYIHGAIFFFWLGLLLVQASLVSGSNLRLHKQIGLTAFGLLPLMVVIGFVAARVAALRPTGFTGVPVPPLQFLDVPILGLLIFAVLAGLSLALRKDPQAHKRLVLLAAITFVEPISSRWPFQLVLDHPHFSLWVEYVFLIPLIGWDLATRKRLHWATISGALLILIEGESRDWISQTGPWLAFARWMTGQ